MANGHRQVEIWGYTLRAMQVYVDLIQVREQRALLNLTIAVRHTQGTDQKVFKAFLDSLDGESDGPKRRTT